MSEDNSISTLIDEQIEYYRHRAFEYDDWHLRRNKHDKGDYWNRVWNEEVRVLEDALVQFKPIGKALELGCGTGWWTEKLLTFPISLTALDASKECISLNLARNNGKQVNFIQEDVFSWKPDSVYDTIFFSFLLSHVPEELFGRFWETITKCLSSQGRVFLIDSFRSDSTVITGIPSPDMDGPLVTRKTSDGRTFKIIKRYYEAKELEEKLRSLGWKPILKNTNNFFVFGAVHAL